MDGGYSLLLQPLQRMPSDARSGVGGRLTHFTKEWAEVTKNPFVLKIIEEGYRLDLSEGSEIKGSTLIFLLKKTSES